jgi:5-methylcytosine-specific restriction enzyme A
MSRQEFSKATMREALTRSQGLCEGITPSGERCNANLWQKARHFDHIVPCAIGGDNSLANCATLCVACHKAKTIKIDVPMIAKAKRNYDKHRGIRKPSKFAGSRNSKWKKKLNGEVVLRN